MPLEIERKYLRPDFTSLREKLAGLNAIHDGAHFESNIVFDTKEHSLRNRNFLLRLRRQCWPDRETVILTMKLPAPEAEKIAGAKVREELELKVASFGMMTKILLNLGYTERISYEKFRECWRIPMNGTLPEGEKRDMPEARASEIKLFLDALPFCQAVEKECEKEWIDSLDEALGLDKLEISTKNYHDLYQEWRLENGISGGAGFVFDPVAKERLLQSLVWTREKGTSNRPAE